MLRKLQFPILAALMFFPLGCQNLKTERGQVYAAADSVDAAVETLTRMKQAGKLSESDIKDIDVIIDEVYGYLRDWKASVKDGKNRPDLADSVMSCLVRLEWYRDGS